MKREEIEILRTPPHSIEAEQSVIGAILLDNAVMDRIESLAETDFYNEGHRLIFEAARTIWISGQSFDAVTISERLREIGKLDAAGGLPYIGAIVNAVPSAINAARYAEIVRDRAVLRKLAGVGATIAESAFNPMGKRSIDLLNEASASLGALTDKGHTGGVISLGAAVVATLDRVQDPSKIRLLNVMPTDGIAARVGRCAPGNLVIVGARPKMGKTAFANQCALMTARRGMRAAFFSLEMTSDELAQRALSSWSSVPQSDIREGKVDANIDALTNAMCRLDALPIEIDDTPGLHVDQLRARARAMHRRNALSLIVVDYLTLLRGEGQNRTQEIGYISRALKNLAKELQCVVLCLAQLNRKLEERTNKRPMMSDLRDSGEIEQDADLILFLYRDEVYDQKTQAKGVLEVIVGANRHGMASTAYAQTEYEYSRIQDLPSSWQPPIQAPPATARSRFSDGQF